MDYLTVTYLEKIAKETEKQNKLLEERNQIELLKLQLEYERMYGVPQKSRNNAQGLKNEVQDHLFKDLKNMREKLREEGYMSPIAEDSF